jgi:hypothetical protein
MQPEAPRGTKAPILGVQRKQGWARFLYVACVFYNVESIHQRLEKVVKARLDLILWHRQW